MRCYNPGDCAIHRRCCEKLGPAYISVYQLHTPPTKRKKNTILSIRDHLALVSINKSGVHKNTFIEFRQSKARRAVKAKQINPFNRCKNVNVICLDFEPESNATVSSDDGK
jgi:hypothetical protein